MQRRRSIATRFRAGSAPVLLCAAFAVLLAGCSAGADYPSLFPSVHDTPPPRNDATLNPLEVQRATEDLISARDNLKAQAPSANQAKAASAVTSTNAPAANAAAAAASKKKAAAHKPVASQQAEAMPPTAAQTAGAAPRP